MSRRQSSAAMRAVVPDPRNETVDQINNELEGFVEAVKAIDGATAKKPNLYLAEGSQVEN